MRKPLLCLSLLISAHWGTTQKGYLLFVVCRHEVSRHPYYHRIDQLGKTLYSKCLPTGAQRLQSLKVRGALAEGQCHKSKNNRQIGVNHTLDDYKVRVRELLTNEHGMKHGSDRPFEHEAVFGQIKECGRFRRAWLRGLLGQNRLRTESSCS